MIHWNLTHNIHVTVEGTPVPWSAPFMNRYGGSRPKPELTEWQANVHAACRAEWPYEPHRGPIHLEICFNLEAKNGETPGDLVIPVFKEMASQGRWKKQGGIADLTNLIKAVEDGITGTIFQDDIQVRSQTCYCLWNDQPSVRISVGFIDVADPWLKDIL